MIRIAVLHASFGRPKFAFDAMREWMNNAKNPFAIEYIMGLDDNDSSVMTYLHACQAHIFGRFAMNVGDSRTATQAFNRIAKTISPTVELIVANSDDMGCPKNWDDILLELLEGVDNFKDPKYLAVSDGITPLGETAQYAMINRAFYNRVGFIQCPEYPGLWADNDLYECGLILGIIKAPNIVFEHRNHQRPGGLPWDNTYWRTNNLDSYYLGQKIFEDRKKRHFDL